MTCCENREPCGMSYFSCIGCGRVSDTRWCDDCGDGKGNRPTPRQRGYASDEFISNRAILLKGNPICVEPGCTNLATVADHRPTRKRLIANGIETPDALIWLFPVCEWCHNSKSAQGR